MKQTIRTGMAFIAIATLTLWTSCTKQSIEPTSASNPDANPISRLLSGTAELASVEVPNSPALCGTPVTKLFAKNLVNYGDIVVGNDATDYYITVSGLNSWSLKNIRLYAGTEAGIPTNPAGNASHADYPIQKSFGSPYPSSWTIKIPIADLGDQFWVSVRTIFYKAGSNEEALWSEGSAIRINNPATKFSYTRQECVIDEGCAFGQGYWYGNGNHTWPDVNGADYGNVTLGGEFYTREEARAIWWANNGQCPGIPDAKKALAFVSAIRLSGASVIGNATLWNSIQVADNWLASLDRLTDANICAQPSASAEVHQAIAAIGAWLDEHDCE